jgi:hypothetical protein
MTHQAIWLRSTSEKNTGFYLSHGYTVAAEAVVGDDNPNWHDVPVVIKIVRIALLKPWMSSAHFPDGPRTSST